MSAIVEGHLVAKLRNPGSKSEHWGFAVRQENGDEVIIEKRTDNPFEHESLRPLASRHIRAVGAMYRGRFIADSIDILD